jgi:hypothetical protein
MAYQRDLKPEEPRDGLRSQDGKGRIRPSELPARTWVERLRNQVCESTDSKRAARRRQPVCFQVQHPVRYRFCRT